MAKNEPVFREPGEGARGPSECKADGDDTAGAYSLLEKSMPPGREVPPHIHHSEEEAWYVVEGELTFRIADRTIAAAAGSFVLVPRGMPHGFGNQTQAPAKFLEIFSPPGMERYFEERAALAKTQEGTDYAGLDAEAHKALARKFNMEFV